MYLQVGIQRFREFTKSTYQLPSTIACKELCDIIEHKCWNKRDGSSNIQKHCTPKNLKNVCLNLLKHYTTLFAIRHLLDGGIDLRLSTSNSGFMNLPRHLKRLMSD